MSINKIFVFCFLIFSFTLIINLGRDIHRLVKVGERVVKVKEKLEQAKEENEELRNTKKYYQSDAFLEEQIRNKLQMAKSGETVLILPPVLTEEKASAFTEAAEDKEEELENWEKWLRLFK